MFRIGIFFFIVILAGVFGCKKGSLLENNPPDTKIFLDSVALSGPQRLNSIVSLYWQGSDIDGWVTGYEISLNNQDWFFTTRRDTSIQFLIPQGQDTTDIHFWVRSIDNFQMRDPSPAYLRIPIKNTPPVVAFDSTLYPYDTVLSVVSYQWSAIDLDGNSTITEVQIRANDGPWMNLDINQTLISFVAENPASVGIGEALVYPKTTGKPLSTTLSNWNNGGWNTLYIRVRDQGGLYSQPDTAKTIFVKPKTSNLLVIDNSPINPRAINTYSPILNNVWGSYDYLDYTKPANQFRLLNPTLLLLLNSYSEVFWFSTNNSSQILLIENAESVIQQYLNQDKKLLMVVPLPSSTQAESAIFRFAPFESLTQTSNAQIVNQGLVYPVSGSAASFPTLKNKGPGFISGINPVIQKISAEVLYRAELQYSGNTWTDSTAVITALRNQNNNKINQIFSVIPLQNLDGNTNLQSFFQAVKESFDW
ncbi:MAG: hypothetical protein LC115_02955 [Bacteroidia bacterium]|nr:hypothetical protein [Bacteroidia bacterium]